MIEAVPHPLDGADLIDVLDYAARRIAEARDDAGAIREYQLAVDRFDEAYMWIVAARSMTPPSLSRLQRTSGEATDDLL